MRANSTKGRSPERTSHDRDIYRGYLAGRTAEPYYNVTGICGEDKGSL
jgi:hypothetical protein